jgi:hypothetical protein
LRNRSSIGSIPSSKDSSSSIDSSAKLPSAWPGARMCAIGGMLSRTRLSRAVTFGQAYAAVVSVVIGYGESLCIEAVEVASW